jgi:hypothetical protein
MISAASAQIEAIGGDHLKTTIIVDGKAEVVPNYAKVQGILLGTISAFVIFITIIGPECVSFLIYSNPDLSLFLTEITGRTLSNRRLHSRTLIKGSPIQLKTRKRFRRPGQKIPAKSHEILHRSLTYFSSHPQSTYY